MQIARCFLPMSPPRWRSPRARGCWSARRCICVRWRNPGLTFPDIDLIVSATAPLDPALARLVEDRLRAPLLEMFGSTETCVFATRRTAQQDVWKHLRRHHARDRRRLHAGIRAPGTSARNSCMDVLELRGADGFVALGRNSDLVEVAGKRASLADITRRLCAVPGVEDAVAFQPEAQPPASPTGSPRS